jgi:hypothetical protein
VLADTTRSGGKNQSVPLRRTTRLRERGLTTACRVLARRLREPGIKDETEGSVTAKLARGTFSVTFSLLALTVLGIEGLQLADL